MQRLFSLIFKDRRARIIPLLPPYLAFLEPRIKDREPPASTTEVWSTTGDDGWFPMTDEQVERLEAWGAQHATDEGTLLRAINQCFVYSPEDLMAFPALEIKVGIDSEITPEVENAPEAFQSYWQCDFCNRLTWEQTKDLVVHSLTPGVDFQRTDLGLWVVSRVAKRLLEITGLLGAEKPVLSVRPIANSNQFWQLVVHRALPLSLESPIDAKELPGLGRVCPSCGLPFFTTRSPMIAHWKGTNQETGIVMNDQAPPVSIVHANTDGTLPMMFQSKEEEWNFSPDDKRHAKGTPSGHRERFVPWEGYRGYYFVSPEFYRMLLAEGLTGLRFEPATITDISETTP